MILLLHSGKQQQQQQKQPVGIEDHSGDFYRQN